MIRTYVLLAVLAFAAVNADKCPFVKIANNFNLHRFQGIWYEQYRLPLVYEDGIKDKCCIATFAGLRGNDFKFFSQQTHINETTSVYESNIQYIAEGVYWEKFFIPTLTIVDLILEFDPDSHVVIYSCIAGKPMVWLQTRDRFPSERVINRGLEVIRNNGFNMRKLHKTQQYDCERYPYLGTRTVPPVDSTSSSSSSQSY